MTTNPTNPANPVSNLAEATAQSPRGWLGALLLALTIALGAAALHVGPRASAISGPISWDEADYAIAAQRGFLANALDLDGLDRLERHRHAPLSIYAIALSTATFGYAEWAVRLPGILAAAAACGLAVLAVYDLAAPAHAATRLVASAAAGLLLATAPASLEMVQVMRPHAFVEAILVLNLWTLGRYLRRPNSRDAILAGLALGLQFVVMEYGPIVLALTLIAIAIAGNPKPADQSALLFRGVWGGLFCGILRFTKAPVERGIPQKKSPANPGGAISSVGLDLTAFPPVPQRGFPSLVIHREIRLAAAACLLTLAALWPAGLFRLHAVTGFAQLANYAAVGHHIIFRGQRLLHVPKYAYAWWYGQQYPLLLAGMLALITIILAWAWRRHGPLPIMFAVFTLGLIASVHAAHIMALSYSLFMIPPLALGGPLAAAALLPTCHANRAPSPGFQPQASLGLAAAAILAMILGGGWSSPATTDPANQRIVDAATLLAARANPGDRVLAQAWPVVRYTLARLGRSDLSVTPFDPRNPEPGVERQFAQHQFRWAITTAATAGAYPSDGLLNDLHRDWSVAGQFSPPPREDRLYQAPAPAGPVVTTLTRQP